jgi:hypothetical protein
MTAINDCDTLAGVQPQSDMWEQAAGTPEVNPAPYPRHRLIDPFTHHGDGSKSAG